MTDADRSQPLNVPRAGRSARYRTHSSGSLSSSFGSPSGLTTSIRITVDHQQDIAKNLQLIPVAIVTWAR